MLCIGAAYAVMRCLSVRTSGVGRILVWGARGRGAEGADGVGCGGGVGCGEGVSPSTPGRGLEMARFDAHLRYSDVLILKFCFAT